MGLVLSKCCKFLWGWGQQPPVTRTLPDIVISDYDQEKEKDDNGIKVIQETSESSLGAAAPNDFYSEEKENDDKGIRETSDSELETAAAPDDYNPYKTPQRPEDEA